MALHEQSVGATNEWYTPPYVFDAMGARFDLDVAHPGWSLAPWTPAEGIITRHSLTRPWTGFVWMNPPFGGRGELAPWLAKFFDHGNGVALVPVRTSAPWWQDYAPHADLILFVRKKIRFIGADGKPGGSPAQGTTLMAAGPRGVAVLETACRNGLGLTFLATPTNAKSGGQP